MKTIVQISYLFKGDGIIRILTGFFVILYSTLSLAHDTLISTTIPYTSGIVRLNVDNDTVNFSNGVKIFSLVCKSQCHIPEYTQWGGGIAFAYTSGNVAYKYDSSITTEWFNSKSSLENLYDNMAVWQQTFGNPDTNWSTASSIPLVNIPGDSLFLRVSKTEISFMPVKYLYTSEREIPIALSTTNTHLAQNTNSIIYFLSSFHPNPNMKFQVISIEIDSSSTKFGPAGVCKDYVVSGITLRWAIDSLGNGLFPQSVSIAGSPRNTVYIAGRKSNKFLKVIMTNQRYVKGNEFGSTGNRVLFSLKGEKVSGSKRSGVFIKQ